MILVEKAIQIWLDTIKRILSIILVKNENIMSLAVLLIGIPMLASLVFLPRYFNIIVSGLLCSLFISYFSFVLNEPDLIGLGTLLKLMNKVTTRLIYIQIDEEGSRYLLDLKTEWEKAGLTHNQINRKEFIFVLDHYRGRFISWMQLPRFFHSINTKR